MITCFIFQGSLIANMILGIIILKKRLANILCSGNGSRHIIQLKGLSLKVPNVKIHFCGDDHRGDLHGNHSISPADSKLL